MPPPPPVKPTNVQKITSVRVDLDRIDKLVNMVGELVITQAMMELHAKTSSHQNADGFQHDVETMGSHMRELQDSVMAVRMQPVKTVFSRMPRLIRELSRQLGKKVKLTLRGENTEVDKTIIELLADPLTHMIRNSLDHGIETPDRRIALGKPEEAEIVLSADQRSGRIIIEVCDDGAGINRERVLDKA
ncbi:MAG: chemotaxis protein CheA, partial [Rhodospirillales bacterium]|nr:chemotaxis protein CheA [Rhodospirillales bacterium]